MSDSGDSDGDEGGSRKTIAAAVVVGLLIVGGWWLMSDLQRHRDVENCIASGRRDCIPIDPVK
jgi:hypothetical protein